MIVTANVEGLEYMKKVWWSKALNVVVMVLVPLMAVRIFFYFIFGLLVNIETGEEIEFTVVEFLFFLFFGVVYHLFGTDSSENAEKAQ